MICADVVVNDKFNKDGTRKTKTMVYYPRGKMKTKEPLIPEARIQNKAAVIVETLNTEQQVSGHK